MSQTLRVFNGLNQKFSIKTKNWTRELNSEWICRIYMAAKMIWTATLNLNSLDYAVKNNLRIVVPYLRYYALFSLSRGVVYTLPDTEWRGGNLLAISHTGAKKTLVDYLKEFDGECASQILTCFSALKADRELISYKAPSSGDKNLVGDIDLDWIFVYLADIIQFNSEIMERSVFENAPEDTRSFLSQYIKDLASINVEGHNFADAEDAYRLDYISRKHPIPTNVLHIMTQGHVEDFFGAWCDKNDQETVFDPDDCWGKIFDVP